MRIWGWTSKATTQSDIGRALDLLQLTYHDAQGLLDANGLLLIEMLTKRYPDEPVETLANMLQPMYDDNYKSRGDLVKHLQGKTTPISKALRLGLALLKDGVETEMTSNVKARIADLAIRTREPEISVDAYQNKRSSRYVEGSLISRQAIIVLELFDAMSKKHNPQRTKSDLTLNAIATIAANVNTNEYNLNQLVEMTEQEERDMYNKGSMVVPPLGGVARFEILRKTLDVANEWLEMKRTLDDKAINILAGLAERNRVSMHELNNWRRDSTPNELLSR